VGDWIQPQLPITSPPLSCGAEISEPFVLIQAVLVVHEEPEIFSVFSK
jgi:hypothetical protein